jgi:hypothetical protein
LAIALLGCGCGSTVTPAAPTNPSHTPEPVRPVPTNPVNMAGNWTGTLESSRFAPRTITVLIFQTGACVDGAWKTDPEEWVGAVSGYADVASFSGSVSFQRPGDGVGRCSGVGTFSGEVGADTIRWTSTGFTGDCAGGLPDTVTMTLRRQ